jgi:hypothetical protein
MKSGKLPPAGISLEYAPKNAILHIKAYIPI